MTEQKSQVQNTTKDSDNPEERRLLRERATLMGLTFSPNISNEKLKARIQAKLNDQPMPDDGEDQQDPIDQEDEDDEGAARSISLNEESIDAIAQRLRTNLQRPNATGNRLTKAQQIQRDREQQQEEQLKLIRCRVTCHNPAKAQLKGEVLTIVTRYLGKVSKYIPFEGYEDGYHIPQILVTELERREYQSIRADKKDRGGRVELPSVRMVKEFSVEKLPPLSVAELEKLARAQLLTTGD